jgi:hypothetical protein
MKMKKPMVNGLINVLALLSSVTFFTLAGNAQDQQRSSQCPTIAVDGPSYCPKPDRDIVFRAMMKDQPGIKATFNWSVSTGRIVSGQGTKTLTVRPNSHCDIVTATVSVDGLQSECPRMASCSTVTDCCGFLPVARQFDKFGDINCEDEMTHLDRFALQLENEPGAQGYIIFYGGRSYHGRLARRGESEERAGRLRAYLLKNRGVDSDRIVMINGGYREQWVAELWIAPAGSNPPTATPKVRIRDMKFRRGKIKKGEYDCGV